LDTNNNTVDYIAFDSHEHYDLFRSLTKISGIGSKTAMLITTLGKNELTRIVSELDTKALTTIPGIGAKTAKRILIELKDSLSKEEIQSLDTDNKHMKIIIKHLTSLGYEKAAITTALESYPHPITADNTNEVITWFVKR
jgi:Holliday junction DNA helicase RuvA